MVVLYEIPLTSNYKIKWSDSFCYMEKQEWWFCDNCFNKKQPEEQERCTIHVFESIREPTRANYCVGSIFENRGSQELNRTC